MFGNFEKRAFEREVFETKEQKEKRREEQMLNSGVPKFSLNFNLEGLKIKSFEDADKPIF